ncbi:hypothetical protein H5410_046497 [Solanum commersonii]|uniref:Uncharacterized protein n=1 Tax=Solanum commersonii TaxID=4109 RepID=A0A9J5XEL2_SOLCO|nr:hypothetical protein H5410_046497 [Solanum commersonii]
MKTLKFQVFEVLVETWTLRHKKGTKRLKRTKKLKPEHRQPCLAIRQRDALRPLFQYAKPEETDQVGGKREQSAYHRKFREELLYRPMTQSTTIPKDGARRR